MSQGWEKDESQPTGRDTRDELATVAGGEILNSFEGKEKKRGSIHKERKRENQIRHARNVDPGEAGLKARLGGTRGLLYWQRYGNEQRSFKTALRQNGMGRLKSADLPITRRDNDFRSYEEDDQEYSRNRALRRRCMTYDAKAPRGRSSRCCRRGRKAY